MMSGVKTILTAALAFAVSTTLSIAGPVGAAHADPAPSLVISAPSAPVTYGHAIAIGGQLTIGGTPTPDSPVQLQSRAIGGDWQVVGTANTDPDGKVAFSPSAVRTADWRLLHPADVGTAEAISSTIRVSVRAALATAWKRAAVRLTHRATIRGTVAPAGGSVRLEKRKAGVWRLVRTLPVASNGSFTTKVRPKKPGFRDYRVERSATTSYVSSTVTLPRLDVYRLHTYIVRTRGTITTSVASFAASAAATYADPRGWMRAHHRFKRVSSGGDFTLVLAQARFLPSYSSVCSTLYSCRVGRNVVINQSRWKHSSVHFTGDKALYRQMVVNHETGHWLGMHHLFCSGPGQLAPVMQQQSKGMQGCRPNAWPLAREISAVS
jgi:Protein of unknown function (DUF3152)